MFYDIHVILFQSMGNIVVKGLAVVLAREQLHPTVQRHITENYYLKTLSVNVSGWSLIQACLLPKDSWDAYVLVILLTA